ncbi:MAG: hypothetical protein ABIQ93_15935, partial [Saprospiraceae bacterium]
GDNAAHFTIINDGPSNMELDWVNYDGQLQSPGTTVSKNGGSYGLGTYITHPFMVKNGQPLFLFRTTAPLDDNSFQAIAIGDGYVSVPTSQDKQVKTLSGGVTSNITFFNGTGYPVRIDWIDFNGQRQSYGTINNQSSGAYTTGTLTFWGVYDTFDNCIGLYFITEAGPMTIALGKDSIAGV